MTISARVIECSISEQDIVLTTVLARYPKFIHGEAKTHRIMKVGTATYEFLEEVGLMDEAAFSRNASSSRAIPVERMIQDVLDDPAMPIFWGKNRPGMQAVEEMSMAEQEEAIADHLASRDHAVMMARRRLARGEHKQTVNRILEPWLHINVLITATDWANFDALRIHPAAQPEMRALAETIQLARKHARPRRLQPGEWHLPFVNYGDDIEALRSERWMSMSPFTAGDALTGALIRLSVARCARLSYNNHEGKTPTIEEDMKLYDRLVGAAPLHASPAEHQATPDLLLFGRDENEDYRWAQSKLHGNFRGYIQYRKTLPNEAVVEKPPEKWFA